MGCSCLFEIVISFPLAISPETGLLDHMVDDPYKRFLMNLYTVFHSDYTNLHSYQSVKECPFLHILANTCYLLSFWYSHSAKCVVIDLYDFVLRFPDD